MASTGAEIASAYVTITTKMPGIQKDIAKELGAVDGQRIGAGLGAKMSAGLKTSLKVGGAAAAAVLGTALVKGFGRLKAIETAQAKMRGIGFDAETVAKAMDNALNSVKGTAFGLGEAATTASQLMAANIKPGQELEKILKTVGNNASLAGTSFDEMGSIFAKAATQANGVQNDVISQLADRGIPIYQELGKVMGVTAGEIFKLASEGKISFDQFAQAAEAAAGTAAAEMGGTTTGAFDNMMAALGRLGAKILEDIFPLIGPLFQDVTKWLDEATAHVEPLVAAFGSWLKDSIQWLKENGDLVEALTFSVAGLVAGFFVLKATVAVVNGVKTAIAGVKAAIVLAKLAQDGWNIASKGGLGIQAAVTGATKAQTFAVKAGAVAQKVLNSALWKSPFTWAAAALAGLVAGLVWFFTKTETGQKIWAEFTGFLSEAWANVSSFFKTVWESYLKPVFDGIGVVVQWLWKNILEPYFTAWKFLFAIVGGIIAGIWESVLKPVFDGIGAVVGWLWNNIVKPYFGLVAAQFRAVGAVVSWLWTNAVQPAFNFIGQAISLVWNSVIKPVFAAMHGVIANTLGPVFTWLKANVIDPVWNGIKATISAVWTNGIKPVIDTLVRVIQSDPKKAFEAARDAIGVAWKGIQDLAKAPVKFVVETVINGLIGTINKIPGVDIPKVSLPKGFARGGILPGMSRMSDGDDQLIMARRGEGMMVSEALRTSADKSAFLAANAAGRRGIGFASMLQGLALGGLVHPMPGAVVTEEYGGYPGHKGIDLALPQGTPIRAAASGTVDFSGWYGGGGWMAGLNHGRGLGTRYKHMMSPPIVAVGQKVKQRQVIGYEGTTGDSTGPHLHYEVLKNGDRINPRPYLDGAGDAGMLDIFEGLKGLLKGQFTKAFPGSDMWIDAAWGIGADGIDRAIQWGKSMLPWGGGLMPKLYDNGGWLQPGLSLVANKTGTPERILTDSQWEAVANSGPGGLQPGDRLSLVVDGEEFEAYVSRNADARISSADARNKRRATTRLGVN